MEQRKSVIVLSLIALAAAFVFAGCTAAPSAAGDEFVICVENGAAASYSQLLAPFKEAHPDVTFRVEALPAITSIQTDQDAVEAKMEKLRTEIMSGRGPDLFLLSAHDRLLIADPDKSMRAGVFLDLAPYMEQLTQGLNLNETVLAAGAVDGAQYLIPLNYSLPGVVAPAGRLTGCGAGAEDAPAAFFETLLAHCAGAGYGAFGPMYSMPNQALYAPVLDYDTGAVNLDEDALAYFDLLARAMAWGEETGYNSSPEDFPSDQVPFYANLMGRSMDLEQRAYQLLAQEQEPLVLPIPNGQGGVTASVGLYAGVRANSTQGELAVEILRALLSVESMADSGLHHVIFTYPINRDALRPLYEGGFSPDNFINNRLQLDCSGLVDQFVAADEFVNAARFADAGDDLVYYNLLVPVVTGRATLEEATVDFAGKYRFYFDE